MQRVLGDEKLEIYSERKNMPLMDSREIKVQMFDKESAVSRVHVPKTKRDDQEESNTENKGKELGNKKGKKKTANKNLNPWKVTRRGYTSEREKQLLIEATTMSLSIKGKDRKLRRAHFVRSFVTSHSHLTREKVDLDLWHRVKEMKEGECLIAGPAIISKLKSETNNVVLNIDGFAPYSFRTQANFLFYLKGMLLEFNRTSEIYNEYLLSRFEWHNKYKGEIEDLSSALASSQLHWNKQLPQRSQSEN
jgi:hypothetical protein